MHRFPTLTEVEPRPVVLGERPCNWHTAVIDPTLGPPHLRERPALLPLTFLCLLGVLSLQLLFYRVTLSRLVLDFSVRTWEIPIKTGKIP
eukprot:SAG31_NODE_1523_length_8012_cov_39.769240_3_plen_90_part_00